MAARAIAVTDVGWKARPLLAGTGSASVVAALSRSLYLEVAGELVWLGGPGATLHGRAIVAAELPDVDGAERIDTSFDLGTAREWRPRDVPSTVTAEGLAGHGRRTLGMIDRLGAPDGFGMLLIARRPDFPLDRAADDARAFLAACAADDPAASGAIAQRLIGLGPGLTPAGDDLIGGAFFARRMVAPAAGSAPAWRQAAARVRTGAGERTHRIRAVLLGDLLDGEGYAPLHDLAGARARGDVGAALDDAARLIRIGHSSGWDILTGFLGALVALRE